MSIEQVGPTSQDPKMMEGLAQEKGTTVQEAVAKLQAEKAAADRVEISQEAQQLAKSDDMQADEKRARHLAQGEKEKMEQARTGEEKVHEGQREAENLSGKQQSKKADDENQVRYEERYENRYDNRYAEERKSEDFSGTHIDKLA